MAKILIVEDDPAIRVMLKMHLSLVGHEIAEAEDYILKPFEPAEFLARIENI